MAKTPKTVYVCQSCGAQAPRWAGRCPECKAWNSLTEEAFSAAPPGSGVRKTTRSAARAGARNLQSLDGPVKEAPRIKTAISELDRVTGGGIVPGSALLIGGEPGIGKSTLLLQVAAAIADAKRTAIYFSGEESPAQVRLRAARLGVSKSSVGLVAETNLSSILATLDNGPRPDLVVVDSIQTLWADELDSAPGTVSQVRAATQSLIRFAKNAQCAVLLVGHVTKDGQIAGPKVVEHMVDTVLYFEGNQGHPYRILRAVKNRFGPTDEIGVFEMVADGLKEVKNPSEMFLGQRDANAPGTAVFAGIEGTRPVLVEIQALVASSPLGTPRRAVVGWDTNRLNMILAVLDARAGISFAQSDVYLNVAGGLKISEPGADLAAAAALLSSRTGAAIPQDQVIFGEISLSGALRAPTHMSARLKEAKKLGFKSAIIPANGEFDRKATDMKIQAISHVKMLADSFVPCK